MTAGFLASLIEGATVDEMRSKLDHWLTAQMPSEWARADGVAPDLAADVDPGQYQRWYATIARSGVVAPRWPARAGGLALDAHRAAIVEDLLSTHGITRLGAFELARIGPAIATWGDGAQMDAKLPGILAGTAKWCQLFSEPDAGSDLPSLASTAVASGTQWTVRGQKVWTSGADVASWGLMLARTSPSRPKREGLTCFMLDMSLPGVEIRPLRQMTDDRDFSEVFLDDVVVDDSERLGPIDSGWVIARSVLAGERRGISGASAGERMTFDITVDDALLANLRDRRDEAARLYTLDKVHTWRNERLRTAPEPAWASLSKIAQSELNQFGHDLLATAQGMRSVASDVPDGDGSLVGYDLLRSRANTIEGGTSEIHRDAVAEGLLGLPRAADPFHGVPWSDVPR